MINNPGMFRDSVSTSTPMITMGGGYSNDNQQISINSHSSADRRKSSFLSFLFAFVALCVGSLFVSEAWGQSTATFNDGTSTNSYVPFYGLYADYGAKGQFIISATDMANKGITSGCSISRLTLYSDYTYNSSSGNYFGSSCIVEVGEVASSYFTSASFVTAGLTTVFSDTTLARNSDGTMVVDFSSNYTYNGGNLLISIGGYGDVYVSAPWYGVGSDNNIGVYGYNSSNNQSIPTSANSCSFAPKTTITYTTGGGGGGETPSTTCPVYLTWSKSNGGSWSGNVTYSYVNASGVTINSGNRTSNGNTTVYVKSGTTIALTATKSYGQATYTITAKYDDNNGTTIAEASRSSNGTTTGNGTVSCSPPVTYTVEYDANGGTGDMIDLNSPYVSGHTVTTLENAFGAPNGKIFVGWNTAANGSGTSYAEGATFTINANTTLYAQWANAYTVTYDANGGSGTMYDWNNPYASGSIVSVMSSTFEPPAGRRLDRWTTAANGTGTSYLPGASFTITSNVTLYAQWTTCSSLTYPLCINFNDYATPNEQYYYDAGMPECWSRIYNGTYSGGEPHAFNGYFARDGVGIVITSGIYDDYNEDFGATNYVVSPLITGLTAGDVVSFNAWWQYEEYGSLTLGYMTDPTDESTFVEIGEAEPFIYRLGSATTGINRISLPSGIPSSAYLAFKWYCPTHYYSYSVVIDNVCICNAVTGAFDFSTSSATMAVMTTLNVSDYISASALSTTGHIEYTSSDSEIAVVNSETGVVTALNEGSAVITATFIPNNSNKCQRYATFTVSVADLCENVGEGGTNENYSIPVNNDNNYTYTQIIYKSNEISTGTINAIGFEYASVAPITQKGTVKIYMKNIAGNKTSFSSNTDWQTGLTEVYSGDLNCEVGWNTFQLDMPFSHNNSNENLLVVIDDNSGAKNGNNYKFKCTTATNNIVITKYGTTNYTHISPAPYGEYNISSQSGTRLNYRPNTRFCISGGELHTLTYNTEECSGVSSSISSEYATTGRNVRVTDVVPTCSNGVFLDWEDGDGVVRAAGDLIAMPSHDIVLYARYKGCDYVKVVKEGEEQGLADGGFVDKIQKFNVCVGNTLTLNAREKEGIPSDARPLTYSWDVNCHDGNAHIIRSGEELRYDVNNTMGHDIVLTVNADNGCKETIPLRVWVSDGLTVASGASAGDICVGAGKEIIVGDPRVVPGTIIEVDDEAIEIKSTKGAAVTKFIPDGASTGECYTSDVEFADFRDDVVITQASNIDYVRINLEHSHIGDVQISLICKTPNGMQKTAVLVPDKNDISGGGKDDATYDWPYQVIECYATYKKYYNNGAAGTCSKGSYVGTENRRTYLILNSDGTYSATGLRQEGTAFDINMSQSDMLVHLNNMIATNPTPADFCDAEGNGFGTNYSTPASWTATRYYYEFDSWCHNYAYTSDDFYGKGVTESNTGKWGWENASLGFGKPNLFDGKGRTNVEDINHNPSGIEGFDYCWSNNPSYGYADGDESVLDTLNHMPGYTNARIVKPSNPLTGTQFYHPYNSFQSLVGCKLNGTWIIQICDSWRMDNGYIFSWEIGLKNVDQSAWAYDVTLNDSHLGDCEGYVSSDPTNRQNLISEETGTSNFYIHPTIQNITSGSDHTIPGYPRPLLRNCELTLIDNIGCETSGNGFTYRITQPTVPSITDPVICIGEQTVVNGALSDGAVSGDESLFRWWRKLDGSADPSTDVQLREQTGVTSSTITIRPATTDSVYSVEIYDAAGCGGIVDDIVTINVPNDVPNVADYKYIWHGKHWADESTDWNTETSWIKYDSSTDAYSVATTLPTTSDNVYVGASQCAYNQTPSVSALANANNLTIGTDASVNVSAGKTLNIAGNLNINGTGALNANNVSGTDTSKVVFKGTDNQTITKTGALVLRNVEFAQEGDGVHAITAANGLTIKGNATFNKGIVMADVVFDEKSKALNVTDSASFVAGKVTKNTGDAAEDGFVFPTGSAADGQPKVLGSIEVSSLAANSTTNVTFHQKSAGNHGFTYGAPDNYPRWWNIIDNCDGNDPLFDHVSNFEFWDVRTSAPLTATLKVSSNDSTAHFNNDSPTHDGSDVFGAYWTGSCWDNLGGTGQSVTANPYKTITVQGVSIPATRSGEKIVTLGSRNHSTVLPIELTSLRATCDGRSSLISWTTATEKNNDYFVLERSDNAIEFYEVARVAGAGNSIAPLDYSYTDYGVHGGDNYYRLVQVDYDGTRTVSEIIVATCVEAGEEPEVMAYPNPFNGDLIIELDNFDNRPARIDVYDVLGKLVYTEDADAPQNNYQTVLHLGGLPEATYTVRVATNDFVINRKVVKQ